MGNNAYRAELLGKPARSPRTGLAHKTHEGVKRSGAAAGDVMRLFVAIAPPAAVLDELDARVGPLRARQEDLRWTNREAWHVTLAFLGQVDQPAVARLMPRLERAARRHRQDPAGLLGRGRLPGRRPGERPVERLVRRLRGPRAAS